MYIKKPKLRLFTHYPLIVYDDSYITIKWNIKYSLFVYINNKVGFRKNKGNFFTKINSGDKYKLIAFGFFGIKKFTLEPKVNFIEKKEIKAQRLNNEIIEFIDKTNFSLSDKIKVKNISTSKKELNTENKSITIDNKEISEELLNKLSITSLNQLNEIKKEYYV